MNSHEVRRRIDGLAERFSTSNYAKYADRLKELCNTFIADPVCVEHYETDVQWSVLQLLLDLSKNPVSSVSQKKNHIKFDSSDGDEQLEEQIERDRIMQDLISSLIDVNEEAQVVPGDEDSLSVGFCLKSTFLFSFLRNF